MIMFLTAGTVVVEGTGELLAGTGLKILKTHCIQGYMKGSGLKPQYKHYVLLWDSI